MTAVGCLTLDVCLPQTRSESGVYVIGAGVHLYIYMCVCVCVYDQEKFEWHLSGPLTFSNTRGRLVVEFID